MRDILRRALRWFSAAAAATESLEIAVLKIHDLKYTITADLDDGVNTAVARGGWSQAPPNPLPGGVWGDVDEQVAVALLTADNTLYSTIAYLVQRVVELQSPLHPDFLNPAAQIVVEARTPDEAASRWALLSDLTVEKLDPAHYRAGGRSRLKLDFTREGLWRGISPAETPDELRPYALLTPGTKIAIVNDGYLGSTPVQGDAPPLVNLDVRPYCDTWMAIAVNAVANDFSPFLWATNLAGIAPGDLAAISGLAAPFDDATALPGDACYRLALGGGSVRSAHWSINLTDYFGYFTAYAVTLADAPFTLRFYHQWGGDTGTPVYGATVQGTADPDAWQIHRLGTVRIPFSGSPIAGVFPATIYYTGVSCDTAGGGVYLGGLLLLPETAVPQVVPCYGPDLSSPITRVSGLLRHTYWTSSVGVPIMTPGDVPYGPYQTINPAAGLSNNLWLVPVPDPNDLSATAPFPPANVNWRVGVRYVPRWRYLNRVGV
jgi:hypothetical protein